MKLLPLFFLAGFLGALPCSLYAQAAVTQEKAETTFTCPYLKDKKKQTIGEMVQGYDGWFFRLQGDLREDFDLYSEAETYMRRLVTGLKARGTSMVFLSVPSKGIVEYAHVNAHLPELRGYQVEYARASYHHFVKSLAATGLIVADVQDVLDVHPTPQTAFFFKRDHHWTPDGARIAATALGTAIRSTPAYHSMTPATYRTEQSGTQKMKDKMALELQRLCNTEMPPETYTTYQTILQAGNAKGEEALFGKAGGGESSVLVGSSYSAEPEFNFDGFLSEATGLPIANHAISGGLLFNALISYASSAAFEKEHPPFLIWEAPASDNLNDNPSLAFRQILPALHGECSGDNIIASATRTMKAGVIEGPLLSFKPEQQIKGQHYYVFITNPNPSLTSFTLNADYDDGDGEWFSIDRGEYFTNTGRFFIELSNEIKSNLTSLSVERASNVNTTLQVKLCRVPDEPLSKTQPKGT